MDSRLVIVSALLALTMSAVTSAQDSEIESSAVAAQSESTTETEAELPAVTYESYGSDVGFVQTQPVPYDGDPFEDLNRAMLTFNDVADRYLLLPIVTGYKYITPDPVERSVDNIFANLDDIGSAANSILQLKIGDAGVYAGRFLTNTTIGVLGIWDVASELGMRRLEGEDFGQTLGYYGVPEGPYLMLPFYGPSTLRDAPARYVDSFVDYTSYVDHVPTRNSLMGVEAVNVRSQLIQAEAFITGDRYTFIRDAYLQRRQYLVLDGQMPDDEEFDEFGGFGSAGESYGGESYGGESYGGESYGGESYGGESYGGESYGGDEDSDPNRDNLSGSADDQIDPPLNETDGRSDNDDKLPQDSEF
ncbi:MlaA family lipoprotein [Umboniibacter marinipuniceus]|uniref:MlaA family lipoprotein n=1 Tax=Umboniibacter marinipuniceus TaxID=569599 RepID=UPI001473E269|nr:VacJ family lipoprotein [Umboniibacter marinipuniceus]